MPEPPNIHKTAILIAAMFYGLASVRLVIVRATSDINVINSAIWRCVLALTAMALSSRAAKAVICEALHRILKGLKPLDFCVSFFEKNVNSCGRPLFEEHVLCAPTSAHET